jgi:hypothetical protein
MFFASHQRDDGPSQAASAAVYGLTRGYRWAAPHCASGNMGGLGCATLRSPSFRQLSRLSQLSQRSSESIFRAADGIWDSLFLLDGHVPTASRWRWPGSGSPSHITACAGHLSSGAVAKAAVLAREYRKFHNVQGRDARRANIFTDPLIAGFGDLFILGDKDEDRWTRIIALCPFRKQVRPHAACLCLIGPCSVPKRGLEPSLPACLP